MVFRRELRYPNITNSSDLLGLRKICNSYGDQACEAITRRSTGRQKRGAFGSLRWRSGAGYHQRYAMKLTREDR